MNKRKVGSDKELIARNYLEQNKVKIYEQNFRSHKGEIDIIGYDDNTLVFFEVKYRKTDISGYASEAVGFSKQKTICRVSDYYRMIKQISEFYPCRFDVIAIDGDKIEWIKNAFDYIPRY